MLEDVCNMLNNGEVPNLFPMEEKAKIVEEVSNVMPVGTMNQKYAFGLFSGLASAFEKDRFVAAACL